MRKTLRNILSVLIAALFVLTCAVPAFMAESSDGTFIYIYPDELAYGTYRIQQALYEAEQYATAENPYTIRVASGDYDLYSALHIYSYTTLDLRGVTFTRARSGNMLRVGDEDGVDYGATGYDYYRDITLIGGIFDGNNGENTIIKAFHTTNFTMDGCILRNENEGHMMEYAGVDGLTIRNCSFLDQRMTKGHNAYEVIQLDVLHPFHITNGRSEDLACKNVLIEDCTFDNVPRAIGSHTNVLNNPHDNITIRRNNFTNIKSIAVQADNWTNVDISGNYVQNAPRAFTIYAPTHGCVYLSSVLAKKGGTTAHYSDKYQKPGKANINIAYNYLVNIGAEQDAYTYYASQAIAVLGEKLTSTQPQSAEDESGLAPAGDYYIDGASIHDNFIDIRGNGIRVENARNVSIENNEIRCSKCTTQSGNFYGIVFRADAHATSVSYNTILNAQVNAIHFEPGSADVINYNYINGTGKHGIIGYNSTFGDITDNDIIGAAQEGLKLDTSKAGKVKWNRVRNCGDDGLYFTAKSSASEVASNTTVKSGDGIGYSKSTGLVKVGSNYTSSAALTSYHIPRYVERESKGVRMGVMTSFKITPDVRPTNAFATFTYTSSAPYIANVDAYGRVAASSPGYAVITVKSGNGITKTYPVLVEEDYYGVEYLSSPPVEPPLPEPVVYLGDVDDDGLVTTVDATLLQRFCIDLEDDPDGMIAERGNIRGDELDVSDATFILRFAAGMDVPYPIGEPM